MSALAGHHTGQQVHKIEGGLEPPGRTPSDHKFLPLWAESAFWPKRGFFSGHLSTFAKGPYNNNSGG